MDRTGLWASFIFIKERSSYGNCDEARRKPGGNSNPGVPAGTGPRRHRRTHPRRGLLHPGPGGGHRPHRHGQAVHERQCGAGHAGAGALQKGQPQIPPGGLHGGRVRRAHRRRGPVHCHCRTLLGGERGTDRGGGPGREGGGSGPAPGGRVQAPHLPLLVPGDGRGRPGAPAGGQGGHRTAHRVRDHGAALLRAVRGKGRSGAGRRPEYAELRPAEGGGQAVQAHPAQAGAGQHLRGVDHVGGIHHGRGQ